MKKFILFLLLGFAIVFFAPAAQAVGIGIDPLLRPENAPASIQENIQGNNPLNRAESQGSLYGWEGTRQIYVMKIVSVILAIAGIVAVLFIVMNGFGLITSAGQEEKVTQHKKGLMWAVVGLLLIILSYSIIRFVISIPYAAHEAAPAETGGGNSGPVSGSEGAGDLVGPSATGGSDGSGGGDASEAPPAYPDGTPVDSETSSSAV